MNSTKSLLLLALVGYTVVSGAVVRKNLAQADCPILQGAVVPTGSATLVSTAAGVSAETTTGSQVISDLSCSNTADVSESSTETGVSAAMGCEAAKRLYLFGGNFDYFDTIATTESGAGASSAQETSVSVATATSSLTSGSSGALPTGVCVSACNGITYPTPAV
jgi:hypothetical protein